MALWQVGESKAREALRQLVMAASAVVVSESKGVWRESEELKELQVASCQLDADAHAQVSLSTLSLYVSPSVCLSVCLFVCLSV
jgi:hypothetical protein